MADPLDYKDPAMPNNQSKMAKGDVEALRQRLGVAATGSNIHTVNKASMYIGYFFDRYSTSIRAKIIFDDLVRHCEAAMNDGKWKELSDRMRGWL